MNKVQVEKITGFKIDDDFLSLEKKIYAGKIYFFKKELKKNHYFYIPLESKLYCMKFNTDNYDDSITETGKYPDSFQFKFDELLIDGRIEIVDEFKISDNDYIWDTPQKVESTTNNNNKILEELLNNVEEIKIKLLTIKQNLK